MTIATALPWYRADLLRALQTLLAGSSADAASPGRALFIVEDHAGMRRMLRRLVERSTDFVVVGEAASAEEAIERLAASPPKLVLVDINLPGMNGIQLIAALRRMHPQVRCVVVSGYADADRVKAAMDAGAVAFVSKDEPGKIPRAIIDAVQGDDGSP